MRVLPCARSVCVPIMVGYHYSGSINGVDTRYCFALYHKERVIGAMIFGRMAMHNQWKRFAEIEDDVIELRRLACINDTPKNTESFFIAGAIKWIKKNTNIKVIVSYADAEYGHTGTIYRASNFECLGIRPGARVIMLNGKKYHDKAIRTKYNGELKPFAKELKNALDSGDAIYKNTAGKYTYVMYLKRKRKQQSVEKKSEEQNFSATLF